MAHVIYAGFFCVLFKWLQLAARAIAMLAASRLEHF
jgi:hypothetical protein